MVYFPVNIAILQVPYSTVSIEKGVKRYEKYLIILFLSSKRYRSQLMIIKNVRTLCLK